MIKATYLQREQIENFFYLIGEEFNNILLHPVIDKKDLKERLAICVADRANNEIYMLGLWFLPDDKLFDRFEFKQIVPTILLEKPPGKLKKIFNRLYNRIKY